MTERTISFLNAHNLHRWSSVSLWRCSTWPFVGGWCANRMYNTVQLHESLGFDQHRLLLSIDTKVSYFEGVEDFVSRFKGNSFLMLDTKWAIGPLDNASTYSPSHGFFAGVPYVRWIIPYTSIHGVLDTYHLFIIKWSMSASNSSYHSIGWHIVQRFRCQLERSVWMFAMPNDAKWHASLPFHQFSGPDKLE